MMPLSARSFLLGYKFYILFLMNMKPIIVLYLTTRHNNVLKWYFMIIL